MRLKIQKLIAILIHLHNKRITQNGAYGKNYFNDGFLYSARLYQYILTRKLCTISVPNNIINELSLNYNESAENKELLSKYGKMKKFNE